MNTPQEHCKTPIIETTPCVPLTNTHDVRFRTYQAMRTKHVFDPKRVNAFDETEFLEDFRIRNTHTE